MRSIRALLCSFALAMSVSPALAQTQGGQGFHDGFRYLEQKWLSNNVSRVPTMDDLHSGQAWHCSRFEEDSPNIYRTDAGYIFTTYPSELNHILATAQRRDESYLNHETVYLKALPGTHASLETWETPETINVGFKRDEIRAIQATGDLVIRRSIGGGDGEFATTAFLSCTIQSVSR